MAILGIYVRFQGGNFRKNIWWLSTRIWILQLGDKMVCPSIIWINLDGSNPSRVMTRKMLIYQVSFFNKTTSAKIFFFPIFFVPPQENFKTSRVDCFKPWFKPFRFVAQQNFKEKAAQLCYSSRDLSLSPLWVATSHVCKLTIPTRLISQNF